MITIKVNGSDYNGFNSASVTMDMLTLSSAFSFKSTAQVGKPYPIKAGDAIQVSVDGEQVIDGYAESIGVQYSNDSHTINISGRDKTADIIDSTCTLKEFTTPIGLESVIKKSLAAAGITASVINNAGTIPEFKDSDLVSPEVGETLNKFFNRLAKIRQVLLSTDGNGNIVLDRGGKEKINVKLTNKLDSNISNIKSGSVQVDTNNRFNKYICRGNLNPASGNETSDFDQVSDQVGEALDSEIRNTRILEFNAEESSANQTCQERAVWEANLRRSRSVSASVIVPLHRAGQNGIWRPNRLINIDDDFLNLQTNMLIKSVTFNQSMGAGNTTTLELITPDAYTLQAEKDARTSKNSGFVQEFLSNV